LFTFRYSTQLLVIGTCFIIAQVAEIQASESEPVIPIPREHNQPAVKVALGKKLFEDVRMSRGDKVACASCHQLSQGGDDGLKTSITNTGEADLINAPTVFNSRYNFRQTWRGKFRTLEQQAEGDLKNPRHGNVSWDYLLPKMKNIQVYQQLFTAIYKDGINRKNVLDAIATYERSLITPDSRFDLFLRGDLSAISSDEKQGYRLFKSHGCIACHQGINLGGNVFQKFGLFGNYFADRGDITQADFGRFNVTKNEMDRFVFRVPSLRNIEVTAPYLHDGMIKDLEQVVDVMARYQLGTHLSKENRILIVKFLKTLTGRYQGLPLSESQQ